MGKVRRETRRPWSQSRVYLQPLNIGLVHMDRNNTKIKNMMESIVNVIKQSISAQDDKNKQIEVIAEESDDSPQKTA